MRALGFIRCFSLALLFLAMPAASFAGVFVSVTVAPAAVDVRLGDSRQLAATVVFDQADPTATWPATVTWTLAGATSAGTRVTADGLLTVGLDEAIGAVLTVTATSVHDPTVSRSAAVSDIPSGSGHRRACILFGRTKTSCRRIKMGDK